MKLARENLALLEEQLQLNGKKKNNRFLGGDSIGLADIAGAGVLAHWLGVLEEVAGVSVVGGDGEYPAVRRWGREYLADEAVRGVPADRDQLLAHFYAMRDKCIWVAKSMLPN